MRIRKKYQVIPTNAKLENGYSTSDKNGYTCEYINNFTDEVVLYSNDNGSVNDITLSDNLENYKYIIIEIGGLLRECAIYYQPNGKYINLSTMYADAGGVMYTIYKTMYANGNTLSIYGNRYGKYNVNASYTHDNELNIYKVIGIKTTD